MTMENNDSTPDIDVDLLEDFENELAKEEQSKKRKMTVIAVGLFVGIGIALSFADIDWSEFTTVEPPTVVKALEPQKVYEEKPVPIKTVATPEPVEKKQKAENLEAEIAKLQEKNMIEEDLKAPGVLKAEKVPEPAPPTQEPVSAQKKDPTLVPAPVVAPVEEEKPAPTKKPVVAKEPVVVKESSSFTGTFSVQVVATTDAVRALEVRDKLNKQGYYAWISTGRVKKSLFKVESGSFKSIRDAASLSRRLSIAGFRSRTAYKNGKKMVTLELGMFENDQHAKDLSNRLAAQGFESTIETIDTPIELYIVREGKYKSIEEARSADKRLTKTGYRPLGVNRVN